MGRYFMILPLAAGALLMASNIQSKPYVLPEEKPVTLPAEPGAELTAATCAACHSLDYLTTQPRGKGAQFWKDSVAKMINVYGAPIEKTDADTIAAYLASTYGGPTQAKK